MPTVQVELTAAQIDMIAKALAHYPQFNDADLWIKLSMAHLAAIQKANPIGDEP